LTHQKGGKIVEDEGGDSRV